jgi:alkylated DNA nucleotide flippase Atl1
VGNAVHKNLKLIKIPCHQVVKNNGYIGKYHLGLAKKRNLLQNEDIKIKGGKIVKLRIYLYRFKFSFSNLVEIFNDFNY